MTMQLSSQLVWEAVEKEIFAVLGMVTAKQASRTVGIIYAVQNKKLHIGTGLSSWKAKHIAQNPAVSITIPIAKRIPLMPWMKIPAATITFSGMAEVVPATEADQALLETVFRGVAKDEEFMAGSCLITVTPQKEFITYGIGVPLMKMRDPNQARGRAPVR